MGVIRLIVLVAGLFALLAGPAQAAPAGALKQYRVPTANSQPRDIANGSDGNRWFTESSEFVTPTIGRITPAGDITEFRPACEFYILTVIVQGPGDVLYYTSNDPILGRITTSGDFLDPVPIPNSIAVGGNLAVHGSQCCSPTSTTTACGGTTWCRGSSRSSPSPSRPTSRSTRWGGCGSRCRARRGSGASIRRPEPSR